MPKVACTRQGKHFPAEDAAVHGVGIAWPVSRQRQCSPASGLRWHHAGWLLEAKGTPQCGTVPMKSSPNATQVFFGTRSLSGAQRGTCPWANAAATRYAPARPAHALPARRRISSWAILPMFGTGGSEGLVGGLLLGHRRCPAQISILSAWGRCSGCRRCRYPGPQSARSDTWPASAARSAP